MGKARRCASQAATLAYLRTNHTVSRQTARGKKSVRSEPVPPLMTRLAHVGSVEVRGFIRGACGGLPVPVVFLRDWIPASWRGRKTLTAHLHLKEEPANRIAPVTNVKDDGIAIYDVDLASVSLSTQRYVHLIIGQPLVEKKK